MGKPKASSIDVPDPLAIIEAEKQANRTGTRTPFGSSRWEGDTQVTEFGPEMDAMRKRMFELGMQGSQTIGEQPGLNSLAAAIGSKIGERYGVSDMPMAGAGKPQQEQKQPPQYAGPVGPEIGGEAQFSPQQPPPGLPNPGYMPPGPPMDPGQLEQLRQRMAGGNNFFFNPRIK